MKRVVAFVVVFLFARQASCDICSDRYIPHQVFSMNNGEKTYTNGGLRTLTARRVQTGGGRTMISAYGDNTLLGAVPGTRTRTRSAKDEQWVLDAYVGIALRTKGWTMRPVEIVCRDLMKRNETVVLFGLRGRAVVRPKLRTFEDSALRVDERAFDIPEGPSGVPGAMNVESKPCLGNNWRPCAVSVSFARAVDTLIVLYVGSGVLQVTPVVTKCGCRCRLVYSERYHYAPLLSRPGACWKSLSSEQFYKCSNSGPHWCSIESGIRHYQDGDDIDDTTVECGAESAEFARFERSFAESPEEAL